MKKATPVTVFLIFVLCVHAFPLRAQNVKLAVELGTDVYFGKSKKPDRARETKSTSPYSDDYFNCGFIGPEQMTNILYVGLKSEFFFLNNRLGLSAGLRLSHYSTELDSDRDYFLWQIRQEATHTDYLRIRNIMQRSYYLGLPLEVRFFLNKRNRLFRPYLKAGAVLNWRLHTDNAVNFQNRAMNHYEEQVSDGIEPPSCFNAYLYPAMGFKVGRVSWFNFEVHFPTLMLTSNSSSFLDDYPNIGVGVGFQFSVQIPLGTNSSKDSK
jgi:hypothetical protein